DLAARFRVERRLVDDDRTFLALTELIDFGAFLDKRQHRGLGAAGVVAEELGRPVPIAELQPDALCRGLAGAGPARPRLGALALHGIVEAGEIDADAARLQRVLRQVERKTVGVVELERCLAVEDRTLGEVAARLFKERKPARQRLQEAALLQPEGL